MKPDDTNPEQSPNPGQPAVQGAPSLPQTPLGQSPQPSTNFTVPGIPEPTHGTGLIPSLPDVKAVASPISPRRSSKKKLVVVGAALIAVLLGGSAAAYLGGLLGNFKLGDSTASGDFTDMIDDSSSI